MTFSLNSTAASLKLVIFHPTLYNRCNYLFILESTLIYIENIIALHYWPFCDGNPSVTVGFPLQKANNAVRVSMAWRHDGISSCWVLCNKNIFCSSLSGHILDMYEIYMQWYPYRGSGPLRQMLILKVYDWLAQISHWQSEINSQICSVLQKYLRC